MLAGPRSQAQTQAPFPIWGLPLPSPPAPCRVPRPRTACPYAFWARAINIKCGLRLSAEDHAPAVLPPPSALVCNGGGRNGPEILQSRRKDHQRCACTRHSSQRREIRIERVCPSPASSLGIHIHTFHLPQLTPARAAAYALARFQGLALRQLCSPSTSTTPALSRG